MRQITTEEELTQALKRLSVLMAIEPLDAHELEELDALSMEIERYERIHHPLPIANEVDYQYYVNREKFNLLMPFEKHEHLKQQAWDVLKHIMIYENLKYEGKI